MFHKANTILGFDITEVMFKGTAEGLKETKVTQPAIFLHSVILSKVMGVEAINAACEKMKEAGARRALVLPVGGAFHSPLMEPAREELATAIANTAFSTPSCPIYQNVSTTPVMDAEEIKKNLILQLTAPVKWTQSVQNMFKDGATLFTEIGPGRVLQGLVRKIEPNAETQSPAID